ncbi:hypothetical protein, partial [Limosilactobacillus vaginalis]|uniref:hypothetical protein n=2 Tax=Limosilactobacillus vaginalis TaxID=1633 RepID=UPI0025A3184A
LIKSCNLDGFLILKLLKSSLESALLGIIKSVGYFEELYAKYKKDSDSYDRTIIFKTSLSRKDLGWSSVS